jgi:hypothetical protein
MPNLHWDDQFGEIIRGIRFRQLAPQVASRAGGFDSVWIPQRDSRTGTLPHFGLDRWKEGTRCRACERQAQPAVNPWAKTSHPLAGPLPSRRFRRFASCGLYCSYQLASDKAPVTDTHWRLPPSLGARLGGHAAERTPAGRLRHLSAEMKLFSSAFLPQTSPISNCLLSSKLIHSDM